MGIVSLSATELVAKAQARHDSLTGNAKYPAPVPALAAVQTAIDALVAANAAVEKNAGPTEHQERRVADRALRAVVKQLAGYVQTASAGDADTILTSGFEVVKRGGPIGELAPPTNLGTRVTDMSGRVSLKWSREYGADMHHVYMSTSNDPFKWELIGVTSKSRFAVDSLAPGTFYWFAVTAIGTAGETSMSEPCRAMAAA